MRSVSIKQLRTFAAAVRSGSLSAAARSLHITPPAVTLQMQLLEEAVGLPLAERTGHGWQPTAAGLEVLAAANRVQAALEDCGNAIDLLKGLDAGAVSICTAGTGQYVLPYLVQDYSSKNSSIRVSIAVNTRAVALERVRALRCDMAFVDSLAGVDGLEVRAADANPFVFVASAGHRLDGKVPISALANEPLIANEQASQAGSFLTAIFADAKIEPAIAMESDSDESLKQAVMAGLGIALISAHAVRHEVEAKRLRVLDVEGTPILSDWFLVKHPESRFMPAAQSLWDFICDGQHLRRKSLVGEASGKAPAMPGYERLVQAKRNGKSEVAVSFTPGN